MDPLHGTVYYPEDAEEILPTRNISNLSILMRLGLFAAQPHNRKKINPTLKNTPCRRVCF
jgi:hypothetical protein